MTGLITRAREQWCQREHVRETVHGEQVTGYYSCPPEVVAALLDVLAWAKTHACAPYANRDCACCTALGRLDDALE
jgi:hypothetical protein